jgi:hypothetical protein
MDLAAASAETERRDDVATFLHRTQPRFEIPRRTSDVDPLVANVLNRQHVVVATDGLESNDASNPAPADVVGDESYCSLLQGAPPVARRLSEPEAQRRPERRRQGKPAQRAGEDKERQRYRTRLDAEAGGAKRKDLAAEWRCEAAVVARCYMSALTPRKSSVQSSPEGWFMTASVARMT